MNNELGELVERLAAAEDERDEAVNLMFTWMAQARNTVTELRVARARVAALEVALAAHQDPSQ